jgi:hypothetical protein
MLSEGFANYSSLFHVPNHCLLEGFSAGGIAVKSEAFIVVFFEGFLPWKNRPTVLFDKDQTLEV